MSAPAPGLHIRRSMLRWWLLKRGRITTAEAMKRFGFSSEKEVVYAVGWMRRQGMVVHSAWESIWDQQKGFTVRTCVWWAKRDVTE